MEKANLSQVLLWLGWGTHNIICTSIWIVQYQESPYFYTIRIIVSLPIGLTFSSLIICTLGPSFFEMSWFLTNFVLFITVTLNNQRGYEQGFDLGTTHSYHYDKNKNAGDLFYLHENCQRANADFCRNFCKNLACFIFGFFNN